MPVDGTVRGQRESIGATSRGREVGASTRFPRAGAAGPGPPPPAFVSGFSPCTHCAPAACSASRRGSRGRARPAGPRVRSTFPVSERETELAVPSSAEPAGRRVSRSSASQLRAASCPPWFPCVPAAGSESSGRSRMSARSEAVVRNGRGCDVGQGFTRRLRLLLCPPTPAPPTARGASVRPGEGTGDRPDSEGQADLPSPGLPPAARGFGSICSVFGAPAAFQAL